MKAYLKIKIKTLAAEARIIRADEQRCLRKVLEMRIRNRLATDTNLTQVQRDRLARRALQKNLNPKHAGFAKLEAGEQRGEVVYSLLNKIEPAEASWIQDQRHLRFGLRDHRKDIVRREARSALIAYGFLRGRTYAQIEQPRADNSPDWKRAEAIMRNFGAPYGDLEELATRFIEWSGRKPPSTPTSAPKSLLDKAKAVVGL